MKFLILFAFAAVSLTAVIAAPEPGGDYNNYQQRNVKVIVERRRPEVRKIIVEKQIPVIQKVIVEKRVPVIQKVIVEKRVPVIQKVIVERRIPVIQKVIVEKQVPVIKKIVEVREPRKIVVVKRPSYDGKDSYLGGYGGGYGK